MNALSRYRVQRQMIGFLDALVAAEVLSPEHGREFHPRLLKGFESAWMTT